MEAHRTASTVQHFVSHSSRGNLEPTENSYACSKCSHSACLVRLRSGAGGGTIAGAHSQSIVVTRERGDPGGGGHWHCLPQHIRPYWQHGSLPSAHSTAMAVGQVRLRWGNEYTKPFHANQQGPERFEPSPVWVPIIKIIIIQAEYRQIPQGQKARLQHSIRLSKLTARHEENILARCSVNIAQRIFSQGREGKSEPGTRYKCALGT